MHGTVMLRVCYWGQVGQAWASIARLKQQGLEDDSRLRDELDNDLWSWSPQQERTKPVATTIADGLCLIEEYHTRMEKKRHLQEQQQLEHERKKLLSSQQVAQVVADRKKEAKLRGAEEKVLHARLRAAQRAKKEALAAEKALAAHQAEQQARQLAAEQEKYAHNPDFFAKKAAIAAYRAIKNAHEFTIQIGSMPLLPGNNDAEAAVTYTKTLLAFFEQQSAANPHLDPDLIEQAIGDALMTQCMVSSGRASNFEISPAEVILACPSLSEE
jgi:NADH dehydrogenase/NADH:ubiquinone oxidoreductase subunit G